MIFMVENYAADEPEGGGRSEYVSKRDLILVIFLVAGLLLLFVPVYFKLLSDRNSNTCRKNLENLYEACQLYAQDHEERLPPSFYADGVGGAVIEQGYPITWAALIQNSVKSDSVYRCLEMKPEEVTQVLGFKGNKPIDLTYGMNAAMSMMPINTLNSPSTTVLFAETLNAGASGSSDPFPMGKNDGFLIGYSSGNDTDPTTIRAAETVTRLAFRKVGNDLSTIHKSGSYAIMADGSYRSLKPEDAQVQRRSKREDGLIGLWSTR